MSMPFRANSGRVRYPLGTIAFYGPDNQRASKAAVSIFAGPDQEGTLRRWFSESGDVRYDKQITDEITAFLKEHQVVQTVMADRIIGCPHEEGTDYPLGGVCPTCSFWWNIDRWTHQPISGPASEKPRSVGRNDPCPCGSGKKYKKCCGAA
jgi:hypothetical protein